MSNLLASLASSAGALEAYGQVLETAQNNVSNASTPGYAKQSIDLYALPFDPQSGVTGGVRASKLVSARDEFSEQAVRQQTSLLGYQQQLVGSLTAIQSNFDISGNQGIPQALNNLFQSFSAWGSPISADQFAGISAAAGRQPDGDSVQLRYFGKPGNSAGSQQSLPELLRLGRHAR